MSSRFTILDDSGVNLAMINGLIEALRHDLKQSLMPEAEKQVDAVVEQITNRFKIYLDSQHEPFSIGKSVNLTWLMRKEK